MYDDVEPQVEGLYDIVEELGFSTPTGSFEGFDRNPFARVLLSR